MTALSKKEKKRLYMKEYSRRPEVKERQKRQWKDRQLENIAKLKEYNNRPDIKERAKQRYIQKRTDIDWMNARYKKHEEYRKTDDFKKARKDKYLIDTYGITLADYKNMLTEQNHVCAICKKDETSIHSSGVKCNLSVDHCHTTGIIRGLLCNKCNRALGYLYDNLDSVKNMVSYLEKYSKNDTSEYIIAEERKNEQK